MALAKTPPSTSYCPNLNYYELSTERASSVLDKYPAVNGSDKEGLNVSRCCRGE